MWANDNNKVGRLGREGSFASLSPASSCFFACAIFFMPFPTTWTPGTQVIRPIVFYCWGFHACLYIQVLIQSLYKPERQKHSSVLTSQCCRASKISAKTPLPGVFRIARIKWRKRNNMIISYYDWGNKNNNNGGWRIGWKLEALRNKTVINSRKWVELETKEETQTSCLPLPLPPSCCD